MKIITLFLLILVASCSTNEIKTKTNSNSFVLNNVQVIDVENKTILPSKAIIIKQGKIDSIVDKASFLALPNVKVIDGKGGYVTPGLIDMHVHMYEKAAYILTLSHGVTHVRIMNGMPKQLLWRDKIESGLLLGSTSTVSSPIITGNKDAYLRHGVETAEEARAAVQEYQLQGYDLIKAYGDLNQTALEALIEEGEKLAISIAKHGPHGSGDMPISQLAGIQSFEHVEDIFQGPLNYEFAPQRLPEIAQRLKETNVPVTPTLSIFYQLTKLSQDKDAYLAMTSTQYTSDIMAFETSNNQVKRWLTASDNMFAHNNKTLKFLQHITKVFHDKGVPLLVGSDSGVLLSPHGLATHNEMRLMQEAGISNFDILTAATITPAKALKLEQKLGKIEANYNADFIYSLSNPIANLEVLREPAAVIKNGYWYSNEQLKTMRDDAIDSRSFWEEFFVILEAI